MYIWYINPLKPNDPFRGRTTPLTSKHYILYIYSTNIFTEHFKHVIYFPFLPLQNAVCFIILTYLVPVLFTFYIQGVLKLKKNNNSGPKRLNLESSLMFIFWKLIDMTGVGRHSKFLVLLAVSWIRLSEPEYHRSRWAFFPFHSVWDLWWTQCF